MNTRWLCSALMVGIFLVPANASRAGGGIGVIGDSYSDEYQFYGPNRSVARNWVEILAATRGVDFGEFRTSSWGEPRNQGYAYNWARSGATSVDVIATGQHTGLASQVAKGNVSIAVIFVGGNDFIEALHSPDAQTRLTGVGGKTFANLKLAADTLLAASPNAKLMIATVPDIRELPEFREPMRQGKLDPKVAAQAASEIDAFNDQVRKLVTPGGRIAVFDFAKITRISQVLCPKHMVVAGRKVDRESPGDAPDHLFLGDVRHLGTMGQGMIAKLLADALNRKCNAKIKPLNEHEIVTLADSLVPSTIASATTPTPPTERRPIGD